MMDSEQLTKIYAPGNIDANFPIIFVRSFSKW